MITRTARRPLLWFAILALRVQLVTLVCGIVGSRPWVVTLTAALLDLSPSLFQQFESLDAGVIDIVWDFV